MAEESRRTVWRRRIAPFALVVALGLLATRTCTKESSSVELSFPLGQTQVQELEVAIRPADAEAATAPLGTWTGRPGVAPMRPWKLHLNPGSYHLQFHVTVPGGRTVTFERAIDVGDDQSRISVPIGDAVDHLAPPS
ncbi:MAG TPA: hypothetical protein VL172_07855 [Kofleriaceae bacterium]|nr:hypothetical protein [Kofleriaceae bacterium]